MTSSFENHRQTVNTRHRILVAILIIFVMTASISVLAYSFLWPKSDDPSGSILIWHTFAESEIVEVETEDGEVAESNNINVENEVFLRILEEFEELNPQIRVHEQDFETKEELREQYLISVASGLGPDLFLGDSSWITPMATEGLIVPIGHRISEEVQANYLPTAIEALTYEGRLYGLPLALSVPALYYNTELVDKPPESLDALLTQAADGQSVLLSTEFSDAYWGVQAFGGRFLDEEGRVILDQGGYANWLDWLMTARSAPGMILDSNRESLRERFLQGDASYYVGYPEEIDVLIEGLGEDNLAVAPLPSGPTGSAGPLLGVDALFFSPASSQNQRIISAQLARYLTNAEQSATLMNQASLIPANTNVRINPRLHPLAAGFLAQVRSAVALPNTESMQEAWAIARRAYNEVLSGLTTPVEAAVATTQSVNELLGVGTIEREEVVCNTLGTIRLIHDWQGADAEALNEIINRYKSVCPLVIIDAEYEDLAVTRAKWQRNPTAAINPDMVLAQQEWLIDAMADSLPMRNIAPSVSNDTLQRYMPTALTSMRADQRLLGLPISARAYALYYNKSLVDDPANTLDRLLLQVDSGVSITLDAQFIPAFWGIGAFGGRLLNEAGDPALHEGGFAEWLQWLLDARANHGIDLATIPLEAKEKFMDGTSAYYVGRRSELLELVPAIGMDNLGIALLPSGPEGTASPLFFASGFFFNDALSEDDLATAIEFALFATNAESQQLLLENTLRIPVNATIDLADSPQVAVFVEQARTSVPIPNCSNISSVFAVGNQAYIDVIEEDMQPSTAAREVTIAMYEACGLDYTEVPELVTPEPTPTPDLTATPVATPELLPDSEPDSSPEAGLDAELNSEEGSGESTETVLEPTNQE